MKTDYNQRELIKAIRENIVVPAKNGEYWGENDSSWSICTVMVLESLHSLCIFRDQKWELSSS